MSVHLNSLLAYYDNIHKFNRREKEVLGALVMNNNEPMTDRAIKESLRYSDMNAVRPRITSLIEKGVVIEAGNITDHVTGKLVRIVKIRTHDSGQMTLNFARAG